jgi:hypothetical protein
MKDTNAYILQNKDALEALFTQIFGKYLMRYYDATGQYVVSFDKYTETSYMNSEQKTIVIASKNIDTLLKANVSALSVAYHELAHVLYTNDRVRDMMRKQTVKLLQTNHGFDMHQLIFAQPQIHAIWNVLEDQRIERLMIREFPFLKDILDPLRSILPEDDNLMTWRRQQYSSRLSNVPKALVDLCEQFAGAKNFKSPTSPAGAKILSEIFVLIFGKPNVQQPPIIDYTNVQHTPVQGSDDEPQQNGEPIDEPHGDDEDADNDQQGDDQDDDADDEGDDDTDEDGDDADDEGDDDADDDQEDEPTPDDEPVPGGDEPVVDGKPIATKQELDKRDQQLAKAKAKDDHEKAILSMLKDIQKTLRENAEMQSYAQSVVQDHKPNKDSNQPRYRIPAFTSIAQDVRNGMTAAQRKTYNSNMSHRVSVSRIVEALANKQEPKVFSNKGKDFTYLKKVVIFEDVSGSTAGRISETFSTLAYSLAKSFSTSEWWLYGSRLAKKHLTDYAYYSYEVAHRHNDAYHVGNSTGSEELLNVMNKYKNEKAVYVIITDGDIFPLINNPLFETFKHSIAIIGMIPQEYHSRIPHHFDMSKVLIQENVEKKIADLWRSLVDTTSLSYEEREQECEKYRIQIMQELQPQINTAITKGLQQVADVVKGVLR